MGLKVQPRASKTQWVGPEGDYIKLRVKSPPVEGAANEEIIELIHRHLRVPRKNIQIRRGERGRIKWVEIIGLNLVEARAAVSTPQDS